MNVFPYLLSISLLASGPGDKVGVTSVIPNDQARNFGVGHAGANTAYIQLLRNTVLPVSLVNFDAKTTDRSIKIEWKTASEKNSSHFTLKRAGDDQVFLNLVQIQARKESSTISNYQFIDRSPLIGNNYYQLEQVDADGTKTLSKIIATKYKLKDQKVYAYFSTEGILNTVINAPTQQERVTITVYNTNGKILATKNVNITEANHHQFNEVFFKEGLYIIAVALKNQVISQKVIK